MQEDKDLLLSPGMSQHQEKCDCAMVHSCRSVIQQIGCTQARLAEVAAAQETQLMEQPAPLHVLQHSLTSLRRRQTRLLAYDWGGPVGDALQCQLPHTQDASIKKQQA